ncbi:hypothetical protein [Bacillus sp. FSL R9-9410]|uniref:hypothetical protein n=1 Tax=Bacillus sp. FSL R9-9410 TaxID=2921590 RepID=UPI0031011610
MNYYVYNPCYPFICSYQTTHHIYRNYYPANLYYTYPTHFDYRCYTNLLHSNNEIDCGFDASYFHSERLAGEVILWKRLGSGGYWKLTNHGNNTVSLQNLGNSRFKGWYLDIDGNTGKSILSERLFSGCYWKLTNQGNNTVSLQNLGNSSFKGWYLDIDGNTGKVILSERLFSGCYWKLTDQGNHTVILQNLGNSSFKDWYLDIDGSIIEPPIEQEHKFLKKFSNIPLPPPYVGFFVSGEVWTDDIKIKVTYLGVEVGGAEVKKLAPNALEVKFKEGNKLNKLVFVREDKSLIARGEIRVSGHVIGKFPNTIIASW